MKACGIIAEYNPFHKGHAYQIEQIRAQSDADIIISVMSGNFLQRGEPAILDKWIRTEMALAGGVDLVVELPLVWSVQPADYFAKGAIQILSDLNVSYLSFGVEDGQKSHFKEAASFLIEKDYEIQEKLQQDQQMNLPYAKKMENIIYKMNPTFPLDLFEPNIQLGLSYQKEIIQTGLENKINIIPIKRKGSGYHEESITNQTKIASATALRKAAFKNEAIHSYIPAAVYPYYEKNAATKVSWEDYFPYLKYQILASSAEDLREIYQMTEGLENRLKNLIEEADSFKEFMGKVKTKRYTQTRLQRLFIYVLLNIKKEAINYEFKHKSAIRILGFNAKGQKYLNQEKNKIHGSILSNVNQKTKRQLNYDILGGNIYRLGNNQIRKQDFTRMPIKFD